MLFIQKDIKIGFEMAAETAGRELGLQLELTCC